jgi:hypothetical protein
MPSTDALIETGRLPSGHPSARIGSGARVVLSIPGLSFSADVQKPDSMRRWWKRWLEPIERHGLIVVDVGRRADLPAGRSRAFRTSGTSSTRKPATAATPDSRRTPARSWPLADSAQDWRRMPDRL